MENNNEVQQQAADKQIENTKSRLNEAITSLKSTADIIKKDIEANSEGTIWPFASTISNRLDTICNTILGNNIKDGMGISDMMSAVFTIERDVILSGWSDEITGKLANALTFVDDYNKNRAISNYFIDLCAFVSHLYETKAFIENNKNEEISKMIQDLQPVLTIVEDMTKKCAA